MGNLCSLDDSNDPKYYDKEIEQEDEQEDEEENEDVYPIKNPDGSYHIDGSIEINGRVLFSSSYSYVEQAFKDLIREIGEIKEIRIR